MNLVFLTNNQEAARKYYLVKTNMANIFYECII